MSRIASTSVSASHETTDGRRVKRSMSPVKVSLPVAHEYDAFAA